MTDANAYDPSTWGSEDDAPEGSTSGVGVGANDASLLVGGEAVVPGRSIEELGELLRSTKAQRDKAQATVDAATAEIEQLRAELAGIDTSLQADHDVITAESGA